MAFSPRLSTIHWAASCPIPGQGQCVRESAIGIHMSRIVRTQIIIGIAPVSAIENRFSSANVVWRHVLFWKQKSVPLLTSANDDNAVFVQSTILSLPSFYIIDCKLVIWSLVFVLFRNIDHASFPNHVSQCHLNFNFRFDLFAGKCQILLRIGYVAIKLTDFSFLILVWGLPQLTLSIVFIFSAPTSVFSRCWGASKCVPTCSMAQNLPKYTKNCL